MAEKVTEAGRTAIVDRLQPWQALLGILTYVVGAFDITEWQTLLLCGFLLVALGFTQKANYKHKEAIKEVVTPWIIERLIDMLKDWLPPPPNAEEEPEPAPADPYDELEALKAELEALENG